MDSSRNSEITKYNRHLLEENARLKEELEDSKTRYDVLKRQYLELMKRALEYQSELEKTKKKLQTSKFEQVFEELDLNSQQSIDGDQIIIQEDQQINEIEFYEHLYEVFFLLEDDGHTPAITWKYPAQGNNHLNPLIKRLSSFVFPDGISSHSFEDDEEESRKNQILFGTLGEELTFVLQNDHPPQELIPVIKSLNPNNKFFAYVLVRPVINNKNNMQTQSQMAMCLISKLPLRQFFLQWFIRSLTQQLKLLYFEQVRQGRSPQIDYNIIEPKLKDAYSYTFRNFPLHHAFKSGISQVKLEIQSLDVVLTQEKQFLDNPIKKYTSQALSKLIHYFILESHLLFVCSDRVKLNQIFQILRILIKPLCWPFPIIYNLTEELLPFLESPVPMLIGICKQHKKLQELEWNISNFVIFDIKQMIFVNEEKKNIEESIKDLILKLEKNQGSRIELIRKFIEQKLKKIKRAKEKKINKEELSEFDLQFMETQMVACLFNKD